MIKSSILFVYQKFGALSGFMKLSKRMIQFFYLLRARGLLFLFAATTNSN